MKKTVSKILIISLIMAIMPAQMVLASENDSEIVETGGENTKTGTGEFTYEKGYYYDADGYIEGDNYLEDDGWTIAITGYSGEATGDVVIPNNIEGHMVTYIKDDAFKGCSELTSVILPDGLKFIGKRTFEGCSGLTNITLPDGLEFIGDRKSVV